MILETLIECFKVAKDTNKKYIGIKVQMFGFDDCEIIINPITNFDTKLEYYKNAYNTDLTLKNAPDKIKIVGISMGDSFEEIERRLIRQ